ncbi:MAG: DNA gyrase C-terminal beta-propeller domain-containing protein, partial [Corynebacterium kroppenstedtii]|nr:DNA gyrase C-terminal beta-propeller domain-containing protein [Corynebacterium kroppenstedtii]
DYDSVRSGGLIAINLNEGDSLIGAQLCSADDDLLLVSEEGQAMRFTADDDTLRPMGRATAGVKGMRFRGEDALLALTVVREDSYLMVATAGGYAKRTKMEEYPTKGRGGLGVATFKYNKKRGKLIGALVVDQDDEIFCITTDGSVVRSNVKDIRPSSRQTMGVRLVHLDKGSELLAIDRNVEDEGEEHAAKTAEKGNAPTDPAEPDPNGPSSDAKDGK